MYPVYSVTNLSGSDHPVPGTRYPVPGTRHPALSVELKLDAYL